jgi:hypothetical protein
MVKMSTETKKIDTNDLRINLTKYLTKNVGDTIYITRYNRLVAEIRVYTDEIRAKTELRLAQILVDASKKDKKKTSK